VIVGKGEGLRIFGALCNYDVRSLSVVSRGRNLFPGVGIAPWIIDLVDNSMPNQFEMSATYRIRLLESARWQQAAE
jgi:hypothetical protein